MSASLDQSSSSETSAKEDDFGRVRILSSVRRNSISFGLTFANLSPSKIQNPPHKIKSSGGHGRSILIDLDVSK